MTRAVFIILAALSVFAFPWQYAAVLIFVAALYLPPVGVALGVTYDALYYAHGWPIATIAGFIATIAAFFLARIIRSRISAVTL
jgi:hypothetical protein